MIQTDEHSTLEERALANCDTGGVGEGNDMRSLIIRHYDQILEMAQRRSRNNCLRINPDDLAHDLMLKLLKSKNYDHKSDEQFLRYVSRSMTNGIRHMARRRRIEPTVNSEIIESDYLHSPGQKEERSTAEDMEEVESIRRKIGRDIYFIPYFMYEGKGLGYKEIARELEIPIGTVMSRIHRARRLVRELVYDNREGTVSEAA